MIELAEIKGMPRVMLQFFYRINTEPSLRAAFLDSPLEILAELKVIELNEQATKGLITYLKALKTEYGDDVYLLPVELGDNPWELMEDGFGIRIKDNNRVVIP